MNKKMKHWENLENGPLKKKSENTPKNSKVKSASKKESIRYYLVKDGTNDVYFTAREMDVASLLLNNPTYEEIATTLGISPRTTEYHARRIRLKLGCSKKSESVRLLRNIDIVKQYANATKKQKK